MVTESTPYTRLLDDLRASTNGGVLAHYGSAQSGRYFGDDPWAAHLEQLDADSAHSALVQLRARLGSAGQLYPGIAAAIDRDALQLVVEALVALDRTIAEITHQVEQAQTLAKDRLDGARVLKTQRDELGHEKASHSASATAFERDLLREQQFGVELEAVIRRLRPSNASRLISAANARARAAAAQDEPF